MAEGKTSLWMYFPHTAAMCTLIALAVCNGPLLYDFTIIYKVTIMSSSPSSPSSSTR